MSAEILFNHDKNSAVFVILGNRKVKITGIAAQKVKKWLLTNDPKLITLVNLI